MTLCTYTQVIMNKKKKKKKSLNAWTEIYVNRK